MTKLHEEIEDLATEIDDVVGELHDQAADLESLKGSDRDEALETVVEQLRLLKGLNTRAQTLADKLEA